MVLATCALYGWARTLGQHLPPWRDETGRLSTHWRFFALLGLVGHVLPFTLTTWGQQEVAAGPTFATLTGYLVPPVAVFLSRVLLGQRLDWNAYLALIFILAGVAASQGR